MARAENGSTTLGKTSPYQGGEETRLAMPRMAKIGVAISETYCRTLALE